MENAARSFDLRSRSICSRNAWERSSKNRSRSFFIFLSDSNPRILFTCSFRAFCLEARSFSLPINSALATLSCASSSVIWVWSCSFRSASFWLLFCASCKDCRSSSSDFLAKLILASLYSALISKYLAACLACFSSALRFLSISKSKSSTRERSASVSSSLRRVSRFLFLNLEIPAASSKSSRRELFLSLSNSSIIFSSMIA